MIVPLLLIISAIIPRRTTMIPKESLYILIVLTILFIVVLLEFGLEYVGLNHKNVDFHHENQGTQP